MGTAAAKVFACCTAFCPIVPSRTSSVSCGASGRRFLMTRTTFFSSSIRLSLVCNRPAVSTITTSAPRVVAASIASNATDAGSLPGWPPMKSAPTRLAQTRSWSIAPARNVSAAATTTCLSLAAKSRRELADEGGLPRTVDADHDDDRRRLGVELERRIRRASCEARPRSLLRSAARNSSSVFTVPRVARRFTSSTRRKRDWHAEVRLEQQLLEALDRTRFDSTARDDVDVGERDVLDALPQGALRRVTGFTEKRHGIRHQT